MRLTFLAVLLLCAQFALAQVSSLPHTQDFEQVFTPGTNVSFIANWEGNEVATSNRIFQGTDARNGSFSINIIPTSTFQAEILLSIDLSSYLGAKISFYAYSKENGATSTRPAILHFSTSTNGGSSFSAREQIGIDSTFPNDNSTSYTQYDYTLPFVAGGENDVIIKIEVSQGAGSGTVAELVMDDFLIEEELPPLEISNMSANSNSEIEVTFNQEVENTSAENTNNYSLDFGYGKPTQAVINSGDGSKVTLTLPKSMVNNTYELTINNVENSDGSSTASNLIASLDYSTQTPFRGIVINEIFADPNGPNPPTTVVLPTSSSEEFIELYNASSESIDITDFTLSGGTIGSYVLGANDYVILTSSSNVATYQVLGSTVAVSSWNSLSNTGETITLNDQLGNLVDSLTYDLDWYNDNDKSEGAWTLEQINPELSCSGQNNWTASISNQGGTPAAINSIYNNSPDINAPGLQNVLINSPTQLTLVFDEIMDESSLETANYSLNGGITIASATANKPALTSVNLNLSAAMTSGTLYTLMVTNAQDCSGNANIDPSIDFVFDNEAPVIDRLELKTPQSLNVIFDEFLETSGTENTNNYSINNGIGNPSNAQKNVDNEKEVSLTLPADLTLGVNYQITINDITDTLGNSISNLIEAFTFENKIDTVIVISNQLLDVHFDESINASATVITNYLVDNSIDSPVSAIIDSSNDQLVHLTFSSSFPENKELIISFSDIQNTANSYLQTLDTSFEYDTDDPDLVDHEVEDQYNLVLNFDEVLDQTSAESINNYSVNNGIGLPTSATLFNGGTSVRLNFNTDFEQEVENEITYTAVEDLSGNAISTNRRLNFTYDTRPPRFTALVVYSPRELLLTFSEEVIENIAENVSNYSVDNGIGQPHTATRLDSASNKVFLAFDDLGNNATNTLTISNQTDLFTNDLNTDIIVEFSSLMPTFGNFKILSDTLIRLQFTKELTQASAENIENYGFDNGIGSFTIEQSEIDASTVMIDLTTKLQENVNYRLVVDSLQDIYGNYTSPTSYDFTFEPRLTSITILSASNLLLDFDLDLDASSAQNAANYLINQEIGAPVSVVQNPLDLSQITLTLSSNLTESETYILSISGILDFYGELIVATDSEFIYDVSPPNIQSIRSTFSNEIEVQFDEPLDPATAKTLNHYSLDNGIGQPESITFSDTEQTALIITFGADLIDGVDYVLSVDRVEDTQGKAMSLTNFNFTFNGLTEPNFRELVINEIYFDVDPNSPLPTFEYIEIFNLANTDFQLRDFSITDRNDTAYFKTQTIESSGFLVATSGSGSAPLNGVGLINFPSLSNNGETLFLLDRNNQIIDSIAYNVEFYNDQSKENGGFSMELINPEKACFDQLNYAASIDASQGTPGQINSVYDNSPDMTAPSLNTLNIVSVTELHLTFTEAMDESSLVSSNFNLQSGITTDQVEITADFGKSISLILSSSFDRGVTQTLRYTVQDCSGNILSSSIDFELGAMPEANELLVTEIMATPTPSQGLPAHEYIEIFNNSSEIIALNEVYLTDNLGRVVIGDYNIGPSEYLILCKNSSVADLSSYGNVLGINSFPTFTTQDRARLENEDSSLVFEIAYDKSLYNDDSKDDGGFSLEMIRLNPSCQSPDNWAASQAVSGGTPGAQNSVFTTAPDNTSPTVSHFEVLSDTTFSLRFSEAIAVNTLINGNFNFSGSIVTESVITQDAFGYEVIVEINSPFSKGSVHSLTMTNVTDCSGNPLSGNSIEFSKGRKPQAYELIITEIMANPTPSQGLPESEYVEIYNTSTDILSLDGVVLSDLVGASFLNDTKLMPGEYMTLVPNSVLDQFAGAMGLFNWPNLNNDSETLRLFNSSNEEIFRISYDDSWYRSTIKANGGYSIEMIDLSYPCVESSNWTGSGHSSGGTPGVINSVNGSNPDLAGPQLVSSIQVDPGTITLYFNERLDINRITIADFTIDNGVNFIAQQIQEDQKTVTLYTDIDLAANTIYRIDVSNITDCTGNLIDSNFNTSTLIVPDVAIAGDILVNEVLFNPRSGGSRFIEFYNHSNKYINLKDWRVGGLNNNRILFEDNFFIAPSQFLGVTDDINSIETEYTSTETDAFIEISSMPSMRDDNGAAILIDAEGTEIDRFDYNEDFHSPLLGNVEGVSLERIDFNGSSNDQNNWFSASSTNNYATPGYANSQARSGEARALLINIDPPSFSPDLAGISDFTTIAYQFDEPGNIISITIFDSNGRVVKRLTENKLVGTSPSFTWDGTSDNGGRARIGYYMVLTELISAEGKVSYIKDKVAIGTRF